MNQSMLTENLVHLKYIEYIYRRHQGPETFSANLLSRTVNFWQNFHLFVKFYYNNRK